MKKVWKPFWSYDVKKTERWLQTRALQGQQLVKIEPNLRLFIFKAGNDPQLIRYHIAYYKRKPNDELPLALQQNGWRKLCQKGCWCVLSNQKQTTDLKIYPVRNEITKRNRHLLYFYAALTMYLLLTTLLFLLMSGIHIFYFGYILTFTPISLWFTLLMLSNGLLLIGAFSIVRLYQSNKSFGKLIFKKT
ncbi:DUF2812 domain-containing protein [Virgibacillus pantothenticus]|uniref:DUF2812 domain-containing protein n=1 Tax=Virgibacillus pantothenticus TaxID=1473 RepID=UPI000985FF5D|nr:DUF2812 domain-containing protein [Virgibacillus pantothenticus]